MLSSRSTKEDDRIKKMREEAMKQRRKEAGAVKLPHVPRSECRVGDPGFVSRKVAPNDEDDLSALLKNGLIDYRELLGTFHTREDYRYLGIDNVPGTPEVNIPGFEKIFENPKPAPRVNGVRLLKDDTASNSVAILRNSIKPEPSSPSNINDAPQHNSPNTPAGSKQLSMNVVKKEPVSPKSRAGQPLNNVSASQSNGDVVVGRSRTTQSKPKPSILKMPFNSTSPLDPNDKTQRANPSKIESIVKEMTEIFPPLTDIQTPVKAHETTFPFPHLPMSKDNVNTLAISGEQHNHGKTDEILKRDLVVTSDDDSDEENERNRASKADPVLLPPKPPLSATSTSSSDTSSSDSSSESESSDSENEGMGTQEKVSNRKAVRRSSYSNLTNGDETAAISPLPTAKIMRRSQLKPTGMVTPKGKVLREDVLEKQVSPLNSISKDVKKEPEISPIRNELPTLSNFSHSDAELLNTCGMGKSLNCTMSPENVDSLANCPRTDGNMEDVDQELRNGDYGPFSYINGDLLFDKPEDLIPPNFDSDSLVAMIGRSPDHFGPMNLPMVEDGDLSAPSTVNLDPIISPGFDTDQSALKETSKRVKGSKKTGKIPMSFPEDEDNEELLTSGGHSMNSSTPMHGKMQAKKDKEQKWFDTIFSPKRKTFDVPYIDVEELISPVKGSNSAPLKVQIPLSKIHHPGKKIPRLKSTVNNADVQKRQKVKGKDINLYANNKKAKSKDSDKSKSKTKVNSSAVTNERPRQSVGKDIEQIKSLMRELSSQANEDEEVTDIISTPSPLKSGSKPETRVSGKSIQGTPVSYIAKKEQTPRGTISSENPDKTIAFEKNKETCRKTNETKKGTSRKRSSSSLSHGDTEDEFTRLRTSKKHKIPKGRANDCSVSRPVLEHSDDSNTGFKSPNSVVSSHTIGNSKLVVSIKLSELKRFPGINEEEDEKVQHLKDSKKEMDGKCDATADVNSVAGPVWKPPPNIKIPRITKQPEDESNQKSSKACSDSNQDCADTDTSSTCSSSCKPSKETNKRKNRPINEGRGVKRREWERNSKNGNANVCGMCGSLQKDSGRDPIRLGAYKTSYVEYLNLGKRSKHRADCLDASERAPKYIDAVLKYIQYLVGLEITGKTGTKNGFEEYMCITSQCIDLVDFVVNQYGKKENNNISNYDSRFVYLCLRLQSVLYFKLYAAKKDSAARYSKLLSEYFKVHRSPHRVNIKGSTGTPSPMSPTSSHTGSVASFGSSVSNGSYEKMLNLGSVVSIPTETFERMQQYFTYTKYLLHGHRLWDDADVIANQCQEFINVVSRRVGAITIQSSMLHLVDYISTGLQVIKDTEAC